MSDDFPAAHSMDTQWFAVDAEGHIGCFDSGEAGAVPNSALQVAEESEDSLHDAILALRPEDGVEYFVDDLLEQPGGPFFKYSWETMRFEPEPLVPFGATYYGALLHLADESLFVPREPASGGLLSRLFSPSPKRQYQVVRISNSRHLLGYVVGTLPLTSADLKAWIKSGVVQRAWLAHHLESHRVGIFEFSHGDAFENWISGPYLKTAQPAHPVKLDQLPEVFRRLAGHTRLPDASFSRWNAIDPHTAGECSSWQDSWVSLDGTVHREEEHES
ncbi:MAG: hypothetical protein ACTHK7_17120 [Aureliella sp.]